jgi:hypothetical protein
MEVLVSRGLTDDDPRTTSPPGRVEHTIERSTRRTEEERHHRPRNSTVLKLRGELPERLKEHGSRFNEASIPGCHLSDGSQSE